MPSTSKARPLHSDQIQAMPVTPESAHEAALKAASYCIKNNVDEAGLLEMLQMMGITESEKPVNARRAWR